MINLSFLNIEIHRRFSSVSLFNGISTFVDYLMPKPYL